MHIPDGLLVPINPTTHAINIPDTAILVGTWAITVPFLVYAWRKTKSTYSTSLASTLAILSALVFVMQMLTFPVAGGTSVHILGGTLIAIVIGPWAGMLSMTLVLGMQAVFFGDGGLLAFGANALNMAIMGSLSFFLVKVIAGKGASKKRFAFSVFAATAVSAISTAVLTGLEIGFSQAFSSSGSIGVTVPAMLTVYAIEGLVEAALTSGIAVGLMVLPAHFQKATLGIKILKGAKTS